MASTGTGRGRRNFVKDLKNEWKLFWETFSEETRSETEDDRDPFLTGKLEILTLDQVKQITKALSSDRRRLNQRMESLKRELELNSAKLEALKVVGGDSAETIANVQELNDLGQTITEQLTKIDERLKMARQREDEVKEDLLSAQQV